MCGRFTLKTERARIAEMFRLQRLGEFDPRYNIAPSQPISTRPAIESVLRGVSNLLSAHLVRDFFGFRPRQQNLWTRF